MFIVWKLRAVGTVHFTPQENRGAVIVQYCTTQGYCTVYTVQFSTVYCSGKQRVQYRQYHTAQNRTVQYSTAYCLCIQGCCTLYLTIPYSGEWYSKVQYSTVYCLDTQRKLYTVQYSFMSRCTGGSVHCTVYTVQYS